MKEHHELHELHDELRAVARDLLAPASPLVSGGDPVAPSWSQLAEVGWLGLEVPEALGGSGATFAETAVVLEELGRVAAAGPFLGCVLAVGALLAVEPSAPRDELLAALAAGTTKATVALPGDLAAGTTPAATAPGSGSGFALEGDRLSGVAAYVVDAPGADVVLVVAGDRLAAVAADVTPVAVVDPSRSLGDVAADGVAATEIGPIDAAALAQRAALAVAVDSVGIAQACLDATVGYAKVRHQFGRAIGSFQAVKHQAADVAVEIAVSRRLVADALVADALVADAPVAMAKAHATETAVHAAGTALQLHGGIGYTWEHGLHVLLKRALLNRALFGSPREHRQRLAERYGAATRM